MVAARIDPRGTTRQGNAATFRFGPIKFQLEPTSLVDVIQRLNEAGEDQKMEEQLIESVRNFPCLWQTGSKSYRDLRARENSWKEVSGRVSTIH